MAQGMMISVHSIKSLKVTNLASEVQVLSLFDVATGTGRVHNEALAKLLDPNFELREEKVIELLTPILIVHQFFNKK